MQELLYKQKRIYPSKLFHSITRYLPVMTHIYMPVLLLPVCRYQYLLKFLIGFHRLYYISSVFIGVMASWRNRTIQTRRPVPTQGLFQVRSTNHANLSEITDRTSTTVQVPGVLGTSFHPSKERWKLIDGMIISNS